MADRILIVGAGAVGGYAGAHMARAGHEVIFLDPWPAHVDAMNKDGLTIRGVTEEEGFTQPVRALHLTDVQALSKEAPVDIAFVCVKSYDTAWATELALLPLAAARVPAPAPAPTQAQPQYQRQHHLPQLGLGLTAHLP